MERERIPEGGRGRGVTATAAMLALAAALAPAPALAQETFPVAGPEGDPVRVDVLRHRGYAAFQAGELARLGFRLERSADVVTARLPTGTTASFRAGTPFFRWGSAVRQMTAAPYDFGGRFHLPLEVLTDVLPRELGEAVSYDRVRHRLTVVDGRLWRPGTEAVVAGAGPDPPAAGPRSGASGRRTPGGSPGDAMATEPPSRGGPPPARVVVIDAGHGGDDPGAVGPGGVREKEVTLAISRALARELRAQPGFEVHMTRDSDVLVPLWQRGERATRWKGERPGIFVSIHANAMPSSRAARGFETYFLAEARTEHARRVAALENAPLELERERGLDRGGASELGFILRELRNLDHQHWSALLAELVQEELDPVHPGQNRGVKQGPFAVITNALMPAVLVEVGFLTNPTEERLLADPSFQEDAAEAMAEAIRRFFERYPPGGREAS